MTPATLPNLVDPDDVRTVAPGESTKRTAGGYDRGAQFLAVASRPGGSEGADPDVNVPTSGSCSDGGEA